MNSDSAQEQYGFHNTRDWLGEGTDARMEAAHDAEMEAKDKPTKKDWEQLERKNV